MKRAVKDSQPIDQGTSDEWCVTLCQCGRVTVQVGDIQQRFTSQEFAQLHRLVSEAMRAFHIAPVDTDAQDVWRPTTTH